MDAYAKWAVTTWLQTLDTDLYAGIIQALVLLRDKYWSVNVDCCLVLVKWNLWGRKWRKKKQKRGAGREAANFFVTLDFSEKISVRSTSAVRTFGVGTFTNISDKCLCTDSSCWVTCLRQTNTHTMLHTFLNTLRTTGLLNCLNARSRGLTFRHRASCI